MDDQSQARLDQIVEDEIHRGFLIKELPEYLQQILVRERASDSTIPLIKRVRFTKLTPKRRRLINDTVAKQYHADLKSRDRLSNAELRVANIERGEWSADMEAKMAVLQERTTRLMQELYADGMDKRELWTDELMSAAATFKTVVSETPLASPDIAVIVLSVEDKARVLRVFDRWFAYEPSLKAQYTEQYAADQGLQEYSADRDFSSMLDTVPSVEAVDALNTIEDLRIKIRNYLEVLTARRELMELQSKQARMYAESVESRRDTAEELARLFYSTEIVDDQDVPKGTLTKTYDQMWDLPDSVIQWLMIELSFFFNAVPDSVRGYLAEWGFIQAPQQSGAPEPSVASLEEPSSKLDSPLVDKTPEPSTESSQPTISGISS